MEISKHLDDISARRNDIGKFILLNRFLLFQKGNRSIQFKLISISMNFFLVLSLIGSCRNWSRFFSSYVFRMFLPDKFIRTLIWDVLQKKRALKNIYDIFVSNNDCIKPPKIEKLWSQDLLCRHQRLIKGQDILISHA